MNIGRVHLETMFRMMGVKYMGTHLDLALYFISHGASKEAVEMNATATGGVHYNLWLFTTQRRRNAPPRWRDSAPCS